MYEENHGMVLVSYILIKHCNNANAAYGLSTKTNLFSGFAVIFLRPLQILRNTYSFFTVGVVSPHPTPKLEGHPLSAVRDCLFNIFAATLHIWRPSPLFLGQKHSIKIANRSFEGVAKLKYLGTLSKLQSGKD
jgi:hypothetical protein